MLLPEGTAGASRIVLASPVLIIALQPSQNFGTELPIPADIHIECLLPISLHEEYCMGHIMYKQFLRLTDTVTPLTSLLPGRCWVLPPPNFVLCTRIINFFGLQTVCICKVVYMK
jgi:hypothetical protein